ncbi:L-threonylcarbamoyladenylate synthase [Flavobacterium paronense]|uniref:Threonylcarbamoyl-AMP synthase n=1 Tax=Flavobacterium paronense TaxID=1392775 RepID=A0ABV5GA80_9FLAO|nr:L-threonylcarbamoyladenylate synthase [Flavobacterium paronense]MDN3677366.1 L-threonylcarbamoyladenylate synthase [Flavobacterium paronense]
MKEEIKKAAIILNEGKVVAIPTETVYGLAANAFNDTAVRQIFEIKQRPSFNPLIVHIKSIDYLEKVSENIPAKAWLLAKKFWPGALTLVLPKKEIIPNIVTAGKDTVGVRVPSHPIALMLLEQLDFPLAAPSANPFGSISPTSAEHVQKQLGNKVPFILDGGNCEKGIESTIIGFENDAPILYRLGSIAIEEIENEIGPITIKNIEEQHPSAPGMIKRHYAPKTVTIVTKNINDAVHFYNGKRIGLLLFNSKNTDESIIHQEILSISGDLKEAASHLYAALHRLDALNLDVIIAEDFPENELGRSINDRLKRASELKNTKNILN